MASAKTFVLPHVLESSGVVHSSTNGTTFGAVDVELVSLELTTDRDSAVCVPCNLATGSSASVQYTFDTVFFMTYQPSSGGSPQQQDFFDVVAEIGCTRTSLLTDELQVFDTEMLALSISGAGGGGGGYRLRESPTRPSSGQTSIRALASGGYDVDSFFDIWTELSLDGGATWTRSDAPLHLTLTAVPETSTALLAGLGLLGLGACRRQSRSC